jgi:hypothetical protein
VGALRLWQRAVNLPSLSPEPETMAQAKDRLPSSQSKQVLGLELCWLCKCPSGKEFVAHEWNIRQGRSRNCGSAEHKVQSRSIKSLYSRCDQVDLHAIGILQQRKPPLLMTEGYQGLIRYSCTIAPKGDLGHCEPMDEQESPPVFIRLTLLAALYGAALVAIYSTVAIIELWLGLAPT